MQDRLNLSIDLVQKDGKCSVYYYYEDDDVKLEDEIEEDSWDKAVNTVTKKMFAQILKADQEKKENKKKLIQQDTARLQEVKTQMAQLAKEKLALEKKIADNQSNTIPAKKLSKDDINAFLKMLS